MIAFKIARSNHKRNSGVGPNPEDMLSANEVKEPPEDVLAASEPEQMPKGDV